MWIGSLRLPKLPPSNRPSPVAGSAPRAAAGDASRASATRSSSGRLRRILLDRRAYVAEQTHVLWTDVDLHAPPLHPECASPHRHDAGGRDEVPTLVVRRLVRLELHVVEPHR